MADRTETTDPIETLQAVQAAMPCRQDMSVLAKPFAAARPSRSRSDQAPADGTPLISPDGWGIATGWRKEERDYRDWWLAGTIRPPETAEERTELARAMAQRWDRITSDSLTGAPDDYRDREKRQARREEHAGLRAKLAAAGLLD